MFYRTFALTGKDTRPRTEMESLIDKAGGSVIDANQIKRWGCDAVLVGYRPGNSKLDAAENRRIPFIIEEDLWKMINDDSFRPRVLTRDQATIYSTTLTKDGAQTEKTREYLKNLSLGVSANQAVPQSKVQAAAGIGDVNDDYDLGEFFEED